MMLMCTHNTLILADITILSIPVNQMQFLLVRISSSFLPPLSSLSAIYPQFSQNVYLNFPLTLFFSVQYVNLELTDVNGDGHLDWVSIENSNISYFLGVGTSGTFQTTGVSICSIVINKNNL